MNALFRLVVLTAAFLSAVGAVGVHADEAKTKTPVRVLSQTVGTDELLLALAEPGQIAGLSHLARDPSYSAAAAEAAHYPCLKANADAESALSLAPTVVLCADYSRVELVNQLRRAGVRVLIFSKYTTIEDTYANIRVIGRELGAEAKAEALIVSCETRIARLRERLQGRPAVRVIAPSTYGVIPGAGTTFQDLCEHSGAVNLAATLGKLEGHATPPSEQMLLWPVDMVVLSGMEKEEALLPYKGLQPYRFMEVIKKGRVALLPPCLISCVSHRRVDAYELLAKAFHPDAF